MLSSDNTAKADLEANTTQGYSKFFMHLVQVLELWTHQLLLDFKYKE